MRVVIAGATGFIGRELCRQLDAGAVDIVPLSCGGKALPGGRATIAVDLATQCVDAALLGDVDVVFHLAGIAHQRARPAVYEQVNHRATLDLAAAAATAGVRVFIFLSSVKAMGEPTGHELRTESHCAITQDPYGLSKRKAELDLQAIYRDSPMSVVILRPALVYGAGAAGNLELMARAVRAGVPRPPEQGGRSMIAVQDLAALLVKLARNPPSGIHTWIVCEERSYSSAQIHDLMRIALGQEPAASWLPIWVWRLGCGLRDLLAGAGTGATFGKIFGYELYSSAALQSALDWRPRVKLADAVEGIVDPRKQREGEIR